MQIVGVNYTLVIIISSGIVIEDIKILNHKIIKYIFFINFLCFLKYLHFAAKKYLLVGKRYLFQGQNLLDCNIKDIKWMEKKI